VKNFLISLAQTLRDSILVRLGLAMGTLALLSFVSIVISTVVADNSSGKASAINLSGSLRMMSFRLLSEVQQPEKRAQATSTIDQFEQRLHSLTRFVDNKSSEHERLGHSTAAINEQWRGHIRPIARAAAENNPDALIQMARDIPGFVERIDQVVYLIEEDLEKKIHLLRATQFFLLGIIILLSLITSWMLRQHLVRPLAELLKAARSVAEGSFSVRVRHTNNDELGQLGQAFNTMIGEIANMYAHLEDKVDEKTRELTRTNQSLELLYRTSQQLSASDLSLETIRAALRDVEAELELGHSMICISENGATPAQPILGNLSSEEMASLCGQRDCQGCFAQTAQSGPLGRAYQTAEGQRAVFVPLGDDQMRGTLPIFIKNGDALPREKARIIETVGHHISNALANMRRTEEKHRLAVLEERSVIARELHDSIAQSLSYLKIQVARLEKSLVDQTDATVVAQELKLGLNSAYKELRELITTFRLRIDERGFNAALQETIEEFSAKLGFPIQVSNTLSGIALSGNEEMHVIRIIREVLSNIDRHAGATEARIDIAVDPEYRVKVQIDDNGRGFDPAETPPNHYGISIVRDRTQSLAGEINIHTAPGQGTRVTLTFKPHKYAATTA
jgi:two-component system, NarL family, nitrate/nitrite sensor histidine kinase NarX